MTDRLVATMGNRACITEQVMVEVIEPLSPELAAWVVANCERSFNADVWLLPVSDVP